MRIARTVTKKARIEIIPMIDTIFFLLVFFMYTSLSMVKMNGLTISLPKPASGTVAAVSTPAGPNTLIATVTDIGGYYLNKKKITPATLQQELQAAVLANPNAVVVVNVARVQTTQSLVSVLDAVNSVKTRTGDGVPCLIASEPVDAGGYAAGKGPAAPAAAPKP